MAAWATYLLWVNNLGSITSACAAWYLDINKNRETKIKLCITAIGLQWINLGVILIYRWYRPLLWVGGVVHFVTLWLAFALWGMSGLHHGMSSTDRLVVNTLSGLSFFSLLGSMIYTGSDLYLLK